MDPRQMRDDSEELGFGAMILCSIFAVLIIAVIVLGAEWVSAWIWMSMYKWVVLGK
jgi:hypothetical protein